MWCFLTSDGGVAAENIVRMRKLIRVINLRSYFINSQNIFDFRLMVVAYINPMI